MALSVSGLYSPSLEKSNSEFLGSHSQTPSPTSYKNPSEFGNKVAPQTVHRQPYPDPAGSHFTPASNDYPTYHQQSPPPSVLRSPTLGTDSTVRPRGQSASRPTLRLHIANPTEPSRQPTHMQEQAVRSTIQAFQTKAETAQTLYPNSVLGATMSNFNTGSTSPIRRRGETFSEFSIPSSLSRRGSPAPGGTRSVNPSTMQPTNAAPIHPHIRITTANLNLTGTATANSSSNTNSTPSSDLSATSATNSATTKRPYRASPLVGPQAMPAQGSATSGTNSSVSTAPGSFFTDEYHSSSVSTPATQESASDFSGHFSYRAPFGSNAGPVGTATRHRPLPVPPPSSTTILPQSTIPSKVASPLSPPAPPPHLPHPPHVPARSVTPSAVPTKLSQQSLKYGHGRSSSGDINPINPTDPVSAELAYRLEKRRGKQPVRGDVTPGSPAQVQGLEEIPYEFRSEKWRGKQKMRDSAYDTLDSPTYDFSPALTHVAPAPPPRLADTNNLEDRESSNSLARSIGGGVSEGGVSKLKGKGKDSMKNLSMSSITGLERDGSVLSQGKELKKSGSISSLSNTILSDSPASSFSTSPVVPPPVRAPVPPATLFRTPAPSPPLIGHPASLIPGAYQSSGRSGTGSPRIASPRPVVNQGLVGRSNSPRAVAWSPPSIPMYVEPALPLNVRKVASPEVSPVVSTVAPTLPPKDIKYQLTQNLQVESNLLEDSPMHTHPFDADADSDEEGRKLFQEVEAVYVSPFASNRKPVDRVVDIGYGYAEDGYEDDERVYVDDGYDDPNDPYADGGYDDLDREYGFGVSASGQLVNGQPVSAAASVSALGHASSIHGGISSSRASLSRESARSPSPMRYARRRRDSLFEDDDDFDSPPTEKFIKSADFPPPGRPSVDPRSHIPGNDDFVYVGRNAAPPSSSAPAAQILSALNPRSPISPNTSSSISPSDPRSRRGRQPTRSPQLFDPGEILGEELEISFAKNPSPTRYHPTKNVYPGSLAVLAEDKIYVRGKWRMRSPSPGMSPTSPSGGAAATRGRTTPGGGLRRYASEESLLSASMASPEKELGSGEDGNPYAGAGFAPLRSRGFEEFNLTSNLIDPKRLLDRATTPDSFESGNPNQSKKSLSTNSHGGSSSGRQTPNLRGPGTKPEFADDYGFGTGFGRAWTKDWRDKKPNKQGGSHRDRERVPERERERVPAKLEKKKSVRRKKSGPRSSSVGGGEAQQNGGIAASYQPQMRPMEQMSYDLWIERGLDQTSAAVRGRKTKDTMN
ncbi:hypothetical protein GYMLUDRAFT_91046 [Collybiopsis luxurians FD-317 M1]|nr:hypothetical protein GYMLUDRAFT_91046 [Collybiopsis luxurians FD-317 M1]